jgi:hypothetical protein
LPPRSNCIKLHEAQIQGGEMSVRGVTPPKFLEFFWETPKIAFSY